MRKKRTFKKLMAVMIIFIILIELAGNFLVVDEKPVKSDVVIVLSGDTNRLEKGIELYKKGYASHLMFSNGRENNLYQGSRASGIPARSIILENHATSTSENALFTEKLMKQHGLKSAIVVSSNYHMRRVKYNYDKAFKKTGISLTYCSSGGSHYHPATWWLTSLNRKITYTEYIKLVGNYFGLNGTNSKKTLKKFFSIIPDKNS
ncbi:YdcF family protein [Peribacillus sp. B-H-3]|jgi:uncharacterized SAM-binding protein YcdF (DUF218 family)|uniref:YdcF family protein n=1 Tax=Peribacillus sp. B-H-3 TaxID=3400420 RepID=UPI003B01D876